MLKIKVFLVVIFCLLSILTISAQDNVKLTFSQKRGFYTQPFDLTISYDSAGAKIRYTLNGTNPLTSPTASVVNSPAVLTIDPTSAFRRDKSPGFIVTACAVLNDTLASKIVTHTYMFADQIVDLSPDNIKPGAGWMDWGVNGQEMYYGINDYYRSGANKTLVKEAILSIPSVSIVTDLRNLFQPDSGIYVHALEHGEEWERAASLELIMPDSSDGFHENCGVRIRGGWSRNSWNPKHAFRIFFREEYGKAQLKYPIFGDEGAGEFDKFDIQTAQNYSWSFYNHPSNTFLREIFSRDLSRDMNQPYTRGRFVHLFVNGSYFGLFQIQERPEASFGASYFGGNKEDYDVVKVDPQRGEIEATAGTLNNWRELWDAGQRGFSDAEYFKVQGLNPDGTKNPAYKKLLDVNNLIDYLINTYFVADYDAPVTAFGSNARPNNFYAIYNRVNPDGFKFIRHDSEHSLGAPDITEGTTDRTGPYSAGQYFQHSNPQWIHQRLSENANYRLKFADRVYKYFYNEGALTLQKNLDRLNSRKSQIESAIIAESGRWGDAKGELRTKADWQNAVQWIIDSYLPTRLNIVRQQLINKRLFLDSYPPQFNQRGGNVEKGFNVSLNTSTGDIYYTLDGSDPYTPYGNPGSSFNNVVVSASADKRVLVPTAAVNAEWKSSTTFDDASWQLCSGEPGGIGYDTSPDYDSYIKLDIESKMGSIAANRNTSCYIRIPFEITEQELGEIGYMTLDMRVDDGFAAYINGVEVASLSKPENLSWNSLATTTSAEPNQVITFDLSAFNNTLRVGTNLLAIHALDVANSSDFLVLPVLTIGKNSQGGAISPTAIKYTAPFSIDRSLSIKTRSLTGAAWSALNKAEFNVREDLSSIKITELMYHPADLDTINDSEFEFIELKNVGSTDAILNGANINGLSYTFGEVTMAPGTFIVLASNRDQFNRIYSFMPFDEYEGQLDNAGETLTLTNAVGDTAWRFRYEDSAPWPEEADGLGYSLVSKNKNGEGDPNTPEYWLRSGNINGSPGADDVVSAVLSSNLLPDKYELLQNYPNPFNPTTNFRFRVADFGLVELKVYDLLGRDVATVVNEEMAAGEYRVQFDGSSLASGVYYYQLKVNDFTATKKFVLIK